MIFNFTPLQTKIHFMNFLKDFYKFLQFSIFFTNFYTFLHISTNFYEFQEFLQTFFYKVLYFPRFLATNFYKFLQISTNKNFYDHSYKLSRNKCENMSIHIFHHRYVYKYFKFYLGRFFKFQHAKNALVHIFTTMVVDI